MPKKKEKLKKKHLFAVIGMLFALVIIQANGPLVQDVVAQGGLAVWHSLSEVSPDGVNSIDDNPQDGLIDVEDIKQGSGSGLDSDLLDGLQANDILAQGGGGFPVWEIKPTVTGGPNGNGQWLGINLGGRKGANDKCKADYGPDAMMFGTQHINCYTRGTCALDWQIFETFTDPIYGQIGYHWFDETGNTPVGGWGGANSIPHDYTGPQQWAAGSSTSPANCVGWTVQGPSTFGAVVDINGNLDNRACQYYTLRVACAVLR